MKLKTTIMVRTTKIALTAGIAAILLTVAFGGTVFADDKERGSKQLFKQADSAAELEKARGIIYDWTTPAAWVISGEWVLDCDGRCANTKNLADIQFDATIAMVGSGVLALPAGAASHSHSFNGFTATSVTVSGDNLVITGTITGSGPIGPANIIISLNGVSGAGTFFFELPGNAHLQGEIGGVIVESQG